MIDVIKSTVIEAVKKAYPIPVVPDFTVEHPEQEIHGDYSTNIALVLSKTLKKNPLEIAESIVRQIPSIIWLERTEAVRPGFINFFLTNDFFLEELNRINQLGMSYGKVLSYDRSTVLFEYGQPNTHKVPHIGHLFSYVYGESCVRLLNFVGHNVYRANYQGDVGLHVAKCLWAYQRANARENIKEGTSSLEEKVNFLQNCYQKGSQAYEEDEQAKTEIDELNRIIYQKDSTIVGDWLNTRQWSLDYYRAFEERLGITYDKYYLESEVSDVGRDTVNQNVGKIFESSEGAIVFRGEKYGLHTRVFINRFGNPTYEAKDVGLAARKREDFDFDLSIYATASEQNEYWQVVKQAIELIWSDYEHKIKHIGFGMINLSSGKMSSRSGNIITAFTLVEEVKQKVREFIAENREYHSEEIEKIAEIVALGAVKYSFLKSTPTKNITFDLETSIDTNGNSGPYLQYTYARCKSILAKNSGEHVDQIHEINAEELSLLKWLYRFPEVVELAAENYAPHTLTVYLFELAQRFSLFYDKHHIIGSSYVAFRLQLTEATAYVLESGLKLLGIDVIDRI